LSCTTSGKTRISERLLLVSGHGHHSDLVLVWMP